MLGGPVPTTLEGIRREMRLYMQDLSHLVDEDISEVDEGLKQLLKGGLQSSFKECTLGIYWKTAACGIRSRTMKKDFCTFAGPPQEVCPSSSA